MKELKSRNSNYLEKLIRHSVFSNIKDIDTKRSYIVDYQLPIFEIILKLIIYFQPIDTKLQTINPSNHKSSSIILKKDSADTFIKNNQQNTLHSQMGDRVSFQIRKQLFAQFQNLQEWRKTPDHI